MDGSDAYGNIWREQETKADSVNPGLPAEGMKEPGEIPIALTHAERKWGRESVLVDMLRREPRLRD